MGEGEVDALSSLQLGSGRDQDDGRSAELLDKTGLAHFGPVGKYYPEGSSMG